MFRTIALLATTAIIGQINWFREMNVKRLQAALALLAVITVQAADARKAVEENVADSTVLNQSAGALQGVDAKKLDRTIAFLLWRLSHKPDLMNVNYLKYYLGEADERSGPEGSSSIAYYWYDQFRRPRCELFQHLDKAGAIVESIFVTHLPDSEFDFDELDKRLGPHLHGFYDHEGHPTHMYSFVPFTSLCLTSPPNTFCIKTARVTYAGPGLKAPGLDDMQVAHDSYMAKSQIDLNSPKTNWQNALLIARERVSKHPYEAEAHIALATALRKTGNVHEAIGEYKLALSLNKYNPSVQQQCFEGLKALKVLPKDYEPNANTGIAGRKTLEFSHGGGKSVAAQGSTTTY